MMKNIVLTFALIVLLPVVMSHSCSQNWECMDVSTDYNFVQCQAGQCACKSGFGFEGSATAADKCRCASPSTVYWGQGQPYCKNCPAPGQIIYTDGIPHCVNPAACEAASEVERTEEIRRDVVRQIYNNLVYPTPLAIIAGQYPIDNLFAPTVKGRVSPVGTFSDFLLVEEYFYALAATPGSVVKSVNIKSLVSTGDKVSVEVDILFNNTQRMYNLTQMGFYKFDSTNRVTSLDLVILNLGAATNIPPIPAYQDAAINQLCGLLTSVTCTNPDHDVGGHYTSFQDCVDFMHSIPYGTWDNAAQNSVVCRQLHSLLTFTRPSYHCPHTGKTGGGKCIDHAYEEYYAVEY